MCSGSPAIPGFTRCSRNLHKTPRVLKFQGKSSLGFSYLSFSPTEQDQSETVYNTRDEHVFRGLTGAESEIPVLEPSGSHTHMGILFGGTKAERSSPGWLNAQRKGAAGRARSA
jgi:hypothetical protein